MDFNITANILSTNMCYVIIVGMLTMHLCFDFDSIFHLAKILKLLIKTEIEISSEFIAIETFHVEHILCATHIS